VPEKSPQKISPNNIFETLVIFSICLVSFLIWLSHLYEMSLLELIVLFKKGLYLPHHNAFRVGEIADTNVLALVYIFLLITILVTVIYFTFFTDEKTKRKNPPHAQIITTIGIIGLLLFTGIQQVRRIDYFIYEKSKLSGKSTDEKIFSLFGSKYQFPKICQKILNKPHQCKLITDLDLSRDPYMFSQRLLSYYLYPKLSMRFDNKSPVDCLVLYSNKNVLNEVPENYRVLVTAENANYILAIRNKEKK